MKIASSTKVNFHPLLNQFVITNKPSTGIRNLSVTKQSNFKCIFQIIGFGLSAKDQLYLTNLESTPNLTRLFQSRINKQRSDQFIPTFSQLETPLFSKVKFKSSLHELKLPKGIFCCLIELANFKHPELTEVKSLRSNVVNEKLVMLKNMNYNRSTYYLLFKFSRRKIQFWHPFKTK